MMKANTGALISPTQNVQPDDRVTQLMQEEREGDVEVEIAHGAAADQTHRIRIERQQRQREHDAEEARQHQDLDRVEAGDLDGIELLADLHGADLRGEGRPRSSGDDDGRHQAAELSQDSDAKQIDGEHLGAELAQLIGALVGDDDADEERQQPDDRQRVQSGLLHLMDQGGNAQPSGLHHGGDRFEHDDAEESDQLVALVQRATEAAAHALQVCRETVARRQLDRWRSAFGVDRVDQRAVFGTHVDRLHRDAAVLQDPLGAQQEPCADGVEPTRARHSRSRRGQPPRGPACATRDRGDGLR